MIKIDKASLIYLTFLNQVELYIIIFDKVIDSLI